MEIAIAFLAGAAAVALVFRLARSRWSFRAQRLQDYGEAAEPLKIEEFLSGRYQAHGVIFDYTGRVKSRFEADIVGAFEDGEGVMSERFRYASGAEDRRRWTIQMAPDGRRFQAFADDVIGAGTGEILGGSVRMTYRLKLPERAGGHVLDVVDWLYRTPEGGIVNRSEMRKFGFKAAELFAVFTPVETLASERALAAE